MKVNYNCQDNDVKLQFHVEDGLIDEVWVKSHCDKGWTVIGYEDFLNGVSKVVRKIEKKYPD